MDNLSELLNPTSILMKFLIFKENRVRYTSEERKIIYESFKDEISAAKLKQYKL